MNEENREKKSQKSNSGSANPTNWVEKGATEVLEHWTGSMVNKKYQAIVQQPPVPPVQPPHQADQVIQPTQGDTSTAPIDPKTQQRPVQKKDRP